MTVNAITDTKKGRTGIAPTYLHTTQLMYTLHIVDCGKGVRTQEIKIVPLWYVLVVPQSFYF